MEFSGDTQLSCKLPPSLEGKELKPVWKPESLNSTKLFCWTKTLDRLLSFLGARQQEHMETVRSLQLIAAVLEFSSDIQKVRDKMPLIVVSV